MSTIINEIIERFRTPSNQLHCLVKLTQLIEKCLIWRKEFEDTVKELNKILTTNTDTIQKRISSMRELHTTISCNMISMKKFVMIRTTVFSHLMEITQNQNGRLYYYEILAPIITGLLMTNSKINYDSITIENFKTDSYFTSIIPVLLKDSIKNYIQTRGLSDSVDSNLLLVNKKNEPIKDIWNKVQDYLLHNHLGRYEIHSLKFFFLKCSKQYNSTLTEGKPLKILNLSHDSSSK